MCPYCNIYFALGGLITIFICFPIAKLWVKIFLFLSKHLLFALNKFIDNK